MYYSEIIKRFDVKRKNEHSVQAICPCHDDKNASLTITDGGEVTLMMCHAGCSTVDIVEKVGLQMVDLFANPIKKKEKPPQTQDIIYDYGEYVKIRKPGKKISYGRMVNGRFEPGIEGIKKVLYKEKNIEKARYYDKPIFICEGEKDSDTLSKLGLYSTTAGGCSDWKKEFAPLFKGMYVILLPDNDDAGKKLMAKIKQDLKPYAFAIKTCLTSYSEKGDVTDYIEAGNDLNGLLELVKGQAYSFIDFMESSSKMYINGDKLAKHIIRTEPFILVHTPGVDIIDYYGYENGVYKKMAKHQVRQIIRSYIATGYATNALLDNVYNLLMSSRTRLYTIDDLNSEPYIINVKNGLYHILKEELLPHTPKYLSTIQLNCRYIKNPDFPKVFFQYIHDLTLTDDPQRSCEKISILYEWLGLLISNINVSETKKALFLYSPIGNTGKSVFLRLISDFLGIENITNIPLQNISDRFAMADLYGKRANIVGDQPCDDIEESSGFKQITGGDSLKIEFKGKTSFSWTFTGGMAVACNALPYFADDKGGHIFDRLCIVPCVNPIEPAKRDAHLSAKLKKELDGIFYLVINNLKEMVERGMKFSYSQDSEDCMKEYRQNIDSFYRFITENYEMTYDTKDRVKKTKLENEYMMWYKANYNGGNINKRKIREKAERIGIVYGISNGYGTYKGLKKTDFVKCDVVDEDVPKEFLK